MTDAPWIGTCRLHAHAPSKRKWDGDIDEAIGILMLSSASKGDFEKGIRAVVPRMGYDVKDVYNICPVSEATDYQQHEATIAFHLDAVNATRPVLVGSFAPITGRLSYEEITWDALLVPESPPLWAVIDGVNWPQIVNTLKTLGTEECVCLYSTTNEQSKTLAPWLVKLNSGSAITKAMRMRAHDLHSGILFQSNWSITELRRHLRKFTMAWAPTDANAPIYFRFYDPRVLLDVTQCLDDPNLGRFLQPFLSFLVQLSPLFLIPAESGLSPPISGFEATEACRDRLLMAYLSNPLESKTTGQFKITEQEFDKITELHKKRAARKLARRLFFDYQPTVSQTDCINVAEHAAEVAMRYGMVTVKQVMAVARALLLFGPEFWVRYSEAGVILNDSKLLPWQKKNKLIKWLTKAYLDPAYVFISVA